MEDSALDNVDVDELVAQSQGKGLSQGSEPATQPMSHPALDPPPHAMLQNIPLRPPQEPSPRHTEPAIEGTQSRPPLTRVARKLHYPVEGGNMGPPSCAAEGSLRRRTCQSDNKVCSNIAGAAADDKVHAGCASTMPSGCDAAFSCTCRVLLHGDILGQLS